MPRRDRMMNCIFVAVLALPLVARNASGQTTSEIMSRSRMLAEAKRLAASGQLSSARALADSLARTTPTEAQDFADILFVRATVAPSVLDAGLDYEKIISDLPSSDRRRDSLLRLAQRALVSGDPTLAVTQLQSIARENLTDATASIAGYWKARALFDLHDVTAACAANTVALAHARASSSPLIHEIELLGRISCVPPAAATDAEVPPSPLSPTSGHTTPVSEAGAKRYAVQLSAFDTKHDADAMSDRLRRNGLDAHVDGAVKPFRVRVGRFTSYAEAAKALRELKARKMSGFVTEISP